MVAPLRVVAVTALLAALPGVALAERLALSNVHAEPDCADEAGAITLLVRTALAGNDRTLMESPEGLTVPAANAVMQKVGADHAVLMELSREGSGLRITLAIVGAEGDPDISLVRAGDGDIQTLAKGVVDHVTAVLKLEAGKVAPIGLGRLRPYFTALRLRESDPKAAAEALTDATPATVLAVPAAAAVLRGLPAKLTDRALAVLAARAVVDAAQLDALGKDTPPAADDPGKSPKADAGVKGPDTIALAARVFAAVARTSLSAADAELATLGKKPPKDSLLTLVGAQVAELHADDKKLNDLLIEGLPTDQVRPLLALGSTIVPARLTPLTHRTLVGYAEKQLVTSPGVASRIGLAAAEANIEVPRALALISVRELDEFELRRLAALIQPATDRPNTSTLLRLRAEVAMRKHAADEGQAVAEYLAAAPDDRRAHRYAGWILMSNDHPKEAAAEFEKAGLRREQSRALLVAGDVKGALATMEGPASSSEELIIQSRAALLEGKIDIAQQTITRAELLAPVSPLVQRAVIEISVQRPDPARANIAKLLVEKGTGKIVETKIIADPKSTIASTIAVGSGAQAAKPTRIEVDGVTLDPAPIESLLATFGTSFDELPKHKLTIAQLPWSPGITSFKSIHPEIIRGTITQILSSPKYKLQLFGDPKPLDKATVEPAQLAALSNETDGVLLYKVEIAKNGSDAIVSLLLYDHSAGEARSIAKQVSIPGVVTFNVGKLVTLLSVLLVIIGAIALYATRAMGTIRINIDKAADVADEVMCIEVTKSQARPPLNDLKTFYETTRKAGMKTKRKSATLIASGMKFTIPAGKWFVHLYGTYSRGGKLRPVPDSCTQKIELKRGQHLDVKYDLTSKNAEVTVHVEAEPKAGVAVWINDGTKSYTDAEGDVVFDLPVGSYTVHVDAHGVQVEKALQILAPKIQQLAINMKRELRFMKDVEIDSKAAEGAVLELAPEMPAKKAATKTPAKGATILQATGQQPAITGAQSNATAILTGSPQGYAATQTPLATGGEPGGPRFKRAETPVPGDILLGRYRIKAELGRGAMGVVHHAWDEKLEREVAIKEMADDLRKVPEAMQLFTQEAKALAQLNHTNIVAMYDQVTEVDKVYMIMEYVDGKPLESIVRARGVLPWMEAVGIMDQACAGLAYAHARKVIHRDIKPANIFVARDKVVKLGDFGLARVMREVTIRKTEIRGTPLYMAPEQIMGTNVDHRADLYALGCTMFELVTGRPPFIEGDILFAQLNKQPPQPLSLNPDLPPQLDELILSLIQKAADDRPGSANEVRTTFRNLSTF